MRKSFPILAEGVTPALTNGFINLSSDYILEKAALARAVFIAPVVGTAGTVVSTITGTYAVGDTVKLTLSSNAVASQKYRKTYSYEVPTGGTSNNAIAAAIGAIISADIANGAPYASAVVVTNAVTITQEGDDTRGLTGLSYTDSTSGVITTVNTATTISEGQPSDLVDAGIAAGDINLASYDTVKIILSAHAAIPFIDALGAVGREIIWFGTPGKGAGLVDLINSESATENAGVAATGFVAAESGDAVNHVTVITVDTTLPAIAGGADLAVGKLAYTLPAGAISIKATKINLALTAEDGNIDADTPDLGIGTVIASGAVAVLGGTATFENILTGQTMNNCSGTAEVKTLATSLIIESADAHTVYLNVADGWAAGGETALPVTGTITIEWTYIG